MLDNLELVADAALALEREQRASLAHQLIASLDDQVDEDAAADWLKVIERRVREVESGEVECQPVEEVLGRLRQRLQ
jgi:hypothetical protein